MPHIAFSTVACPDWTLQQVADAAARFEYDGVELRTFGTGSTSFACDPCLTSSAKIRRMFRDAGVVVSSLATSICFDAPIRPRIIGRVFGDQEQAVSEARRAIDLAAQIECPFVRVCGFEVPAGEKRRSTVRLIVERLAAIADHAHRTGVRIAFENGGSFPTARDVVEIIDPLHDPLIGLSWCVRTGVLAGEKPLPDAIADRTLILRVRDWRDGQLTGDDACQQAARALCDSGPTDSCVVFEWCRAWVQCEGDVDAVLKGAANRLFNWTNCELSPGAA